MRSAFIIATLSFAIILLTAVSMIKIIPDFGQREFFVRWGAIIIIVSLTVGVLASRRIQ